MMNKLSILLIVTLMSLMGCAGHQTFNHIARSNDTVAVGAGWMQTFSRDRIRVTITDFDGTQTIYEPGDISTRAVINMYPDPASNMVVSRETGIALSPFATTYADQINTNYTSGDNDWWQTIVFVNLPGGMAVGDANILIESIDPVTLLAVETASSTVEIVPGAGEAYPFSAKYPWGTPFDLSSDHLKSLERSSHYQIDFNFNGGAEEIPAAISLELTHAPDVDNGGAGRALVVNPTSDAKSIHWVDNGTVTKAVILPLTSAGFSSLVDFKFYVSGIDDVNVDVSNFHAYDQDGVEIFTVEATSTKY